MSNQSDSINRKDFFKLMGVAAAGAVFVKAFGVASLIPSALADAYKGLKSPPPAGKKIADPLTGAGKTQSYVYLAKNYAGPKRPAIKADSNCTNCMHYKPNKTVSEHWAPCAVLAQSFVYSEGMCALYMKNPKA